MFQPIQPNQNSQTRKFNPWLLFGVFLLVVAAAGAFFLKGGGDTDTPPSIKIGNVLLKGELEKVDVKDFGVSFHYVDSDTALADFYDASKCQGTDISKAGLFTYSPGGEPEMANKGWYVYPKEWGGNNQIGDPTAFTVKRGRPFILFFKKSDFPNGITNTCFKGSGDLSKEGPFVTEGTKGWVLVASNKDKLSELIEAKECVKSVWVLNGVGTFDLLAIPYVKVPLGQIDSHTLGVGKLLWIKLSCEQAGGGGEQAGGGGQTVTPATKTTTNVAVLPNPPPGTVLFGWNKPPETDGAQVTGYNFYVNDKAYPKSADDTESFFPVTPGTTYKVNICVIYNGDNTNLYCGKEITYVVPPAETPAGQPAAPNNVAVTTPNNNVLQMGLALKIDNSDPQTPNWTNPIEQTQFKLTELQAGGLQLRVTDPNTESFQKNQSGAYVMNYKWKLDKENIRENNFTYTTVWSTDWNANFPESIDGECVQEVSQTGEASLKDAWTCPSAKIPASAFANLNPGAYVIGVEAGDGKKGSGWSYASLFITSPPVEGATPAQNTDKNDGNTKAPALSKLQINDNFFDIVVAQHDALSWWNKSQQNTKEVYKYFAYKINLSDYAKATLSSGQYEPTSFKFSIGYTQKWTESAGVNPWFKQPNNFGQDIDLSFDDSDQNSKLELPSPNNNKNFYSSDNSIYVRVPIPFPGLPLISDYNESKNQTAKTNGQVDIWGATSIYMRFDQNNGQPKIDKTLPELTMQRPDLKVVQGGGSCDGNNLSHVIQNAGGPLPVEQLHRIRIFTPDHAQNYKQLFALSFSSYFANINNVLNGNGGQSNASCIEHGHYGNGGLDTRIYLLRDEGTQNNTIFPVHK